VRNLKRNHLALVNAVLQQSVVERQTLRNAIAQRMDALAQRQDVSTACTVQDSAMGYWQEIQGALQAETTTIARDQTG